MYECDKALTDPAAVCHIKSMKETKAQMTVWLVAPGADYEGEDVSRARLFHNEADARVYEAELNAEGLLGFDYVVVREMEVG